MSESPQLALQQTQAFRSFLTRFISHCRDKSVVSSHLDEAELLLVSLSLRRATASTLLAKIRQWDMRTDYLQVAFMALLTDLTDYCRTHTNHTLAQKYQANALSKVVVEAGIAVLESFADHQAIISRQLQLTSCLLQLSWTISNVDTFKVLYRRLSDVKQFYTSTFKDQQKQLFMKTVEGCLRIASQQKILAPFEYILATILAELELKVEPTSEVTHGRIRIVRLLLRYLWTPQLDLLLRLAFAVLKIYRHTSNNFYIFSSLLNVYEILIEQLIKIDSMVALLVYQNVILNPLREQLKIKTGEGQIDRAKCSILLSCLSKLFDELYLTYFTQTYDWNFYEVPICQQSLSDLLEFVQSKANQSSTIFSLVKEHAELIELKVKAFLKSVQPKLPKAASQSFKLYQQRQNEYQALVSEMNNKPKRIHAKLQKIEPFKREAEMLYLSRVMRRSDKLSLKSMTELVGSDNQNSHNLCQAYAREILGSCCSTNMQEFIRLFISNFFLTGESQQILRVLDIVTKVFFANQPPNNRILATSDAAYTFANAIILLNSDLHNDKNQNKMSEAAFLNICSKINNGADLPSHILVSTYQNVKQYEIVNFRRRDHMQEVSLAIWMVLCSESQKQVLQEIDPHLKDPTGEVYCEYITQVLSSAIDSHQVSRVQNLINNFKYSETNYECEIIEILRRCESKNPSLVRTAFEKVLTCAKFKTANADATAASFLWLAVQIVTKFHSSLPTEFICEFFISTWNLRQDFQDNIFLFEEVEQRRIRKAIVMEQRRIAKKSIMSLFSSFLTSSNDDYLDPPAIKPVSIDSKVNVKPLMAQVFGIICQQQYFIAAQSTMIAYLRNGEHKLLAEFMSCVSFVFNVTLVSMSYTSDINELISECLGLSESKLGSRIVTLKNKDYPKFQILELYTCYWCLKLTFLRLKNGLSVTDTPCLNRSLKMLTLFSAEMFCELANYLKQCSSQQKAKQITKVFQKEAKNVADINQDHKNQLKWLYQLQEKQEKQQQTNGEQKITQKNTKLNENQKQNQNIKQNVTVVKSETQMKRQSNCEGVTITEGPILIQEAQSQMISNQCNQQGHGGIVQNQTSILPAQSLIQANIKAGNSQNQQGSKPIDKLSQGILEQHSSQITHIQQVSHLNQQQSNSKHRYNEYKPQVKLQSVQVQSAAKLGHIVKSFERLEQINESVINNTRTKQSDKSGVGTTQQTKQVSKSSPGIETAVQRSKPEWTSTGDLEERELTLEEMERLGIPVYML